MSFRAAVLFTDHTTVARVDSKALGRGTTVELEPELGLDGWTRDARFDLGIRLGRRHQVQVGFLHLARRGRRTIDRRIQFGDAVFDVAIPVETSVDLTLVPFVYRFSPVRTDRFDFGLSGGVFALFLDATVEAPAAEVRESGAAEFPLPVIGADAVFALYPRLHMAGGLKYFGLEVGGVDGVWREYRAAAEYFPVDRLGVGVGYRVISMEADGTEGILRRDEGTLLFLDYEFRGPHVYLTIVL